MHKCEVHNHTASVARSLAVAVVLAALCAVPASAQSVPSPWSGSDIGSPAVAGSSSSVDGTTFDISAAGADIWGGSDQFHFVYRAIDGDVEVTARVDAVSFAHAWSKAGVMVRSSLAADAAHGYVLVSAGKGLAFQRRTAGGGITTHTAGAFAAAPYWVRIVRQGTTVTAYVSPDGTTWSSLGSDTIALGRTAYVGLAVTSHATAAATNARVSEVGVRQITPPPAVPPPFQTSDIGAPAVAGSARHANGTFTLDGAGVDIWGTADQFHYVYQPITGDVDVRARVASVTYQHRWSKAGVMVREALTGESRHATALTSAGAGYAFQRRLDTAGLSTSTSGGAGAPPGWVRLVRTGDRFEAFRSDDGHAWTSMGSDTIPMATTVYVGLAVTSHNAGAAAQAQFDNVSVAQQQPPANEPPVVSLTSPASGQTFTAPATISVSASASDPESRLSRVDFFANGSSIGSDTTAPYSISWASVPAGSYSVTAVAHDADGASTTSTAVSVTVQAANQPPTVAITSPANGATFTAPASFTVAANASDPESAMARVEFYRDNVLIATDTAAPYTASVSSLAAGTYVFTARAYDTAGAQASSAAVSVTVNANQAPTVAITSPANGASFAEPASFTVTASASDADGSVARVEFYRGTTLLGTDTAAPYQAAVASLGAGTHTFTAVAYDAAGASRQSAGVTVTVTAQPSAPRLVVFNASADHGIVTRYVLEIFAAGADPATATPVATSDLGKPAPDAAGEITVDRSAFFSALAPGNYVATVRAENGTARSRSAPVSFTR